MHKDLSDKDLLINGIPFANERTISVSCKEILDNPACEISTTKLYSYEQMLSMFTSGSTYMVNETNKAFDNYKKGLDKPFRIMKTLCVGQSASFPMEKWSATRAAASSLKRQFGCMFTVHKSQVSDTRFEVIATRFR